MKNTNGLNYLSDVFAIIMTATQSNEVFQIISLVLTIVATAFSIVLTGIKFVAWLKEALKDGQITKEEIDEGQKIIDDIKPKDDHK